MPRISFTRNLASHVECEPRVVGGETVRAALDEYFVTNPAPRTYVLDEHGAVRKHVVVFVDGVQCRDRTELGDPVEAASEIYVMQALSGG